MIVSFSVENWMSFRNRQTFSMVASSDRKHRERVPRIGKYNKRLLPIASFYGGNASGKTNLFKALSFVKSFVVNGTKPNCPIPVEPFILDAESNKKPSTFVVELLIDEVIYEFSFTVTYKKVLEEKLIKIVGRHEEVLYRRNQTYMTMHRSFNNIKFIESLFNDTRENQLFLTNSVSQKVNDFRPVYDWFCNCLEIIAPDSRFEIFERYLYESDQLFSIMNDVIAQLDAGITHLGTQEIPIENSQIPEAVKNKLKEDLQNDGNYILRVKETGQKIIVRRNGSELVTKRLVAFHKDESGADVPFDLQAESEGVQRAIELLPVFVDLCHGRSNKVYVIDELDRSLHTILTKNLIEAYLENCSQDSRSQLLFNAHDILLMDRDLFRLDEMWITQRDKSGASNLISFCEYKDIRLDKDIRKSYLQGRFGGIPHPLIKVALRTRSL